MYNLLFIWLNLSSEMTETLLAMPSLSPDQSSARNSVRFHFMTTLTQPKSPSLKIIQNPTKMKYSYRRSIYYIIVLVITSNLL